jgi:2'-hydroxyisoflavone reductase
MDLLVLGGTRFVGRHLVDAALARGHRVTIFTRGKHGIDLFPDAERLEGERGGDLEPLHGRRWDAVVDTSGMIAADVRRSAELLKDATGTYAFVSTISVYSGSENGMDETAPVHPPDWESTEVKGDTYGGMKSACEDAVREGFGDRALVVRPGVIIGPHDYTNRFPYWCHRIADGGEVLAPGDGTQPVQGIDARDLAGWMLRMVEAGAAGTYNAVAPERRTTLREMLEAIREGVGGDARFTWVAAGFLREHEVAEWTEMPFWIADPAEHGVQMVDNSRALAAGLALRPLADTARDTLQSDRAHPPADERKGGITREREAELLASWHARDGEAEAEDGEETEGGGEASAES